MRNAELQSRVPVQLRELVANLNLAVIEHMIALIDASDFPFEDPELLEGLIDGL